MDTVTDMGMDMGMVEDFNIVKDITIDQSIFHHHGLVDGVEDMEDTEVPGRVLLRAVMEVDMELVMDMVLGMESDSDVNFMNLFIIKFPSFKY